MHRDMKIGLSLGVLLVGIVGALFFRREPDKKKDAPPALQNEKQFDAEIAERPNGPYITGTEEINEPATKAPRSGNARTKANANRSAYEAPEFLTKEDQKANSEFLGNGNRTAPDPIAPTQVNSQNKSQAPAPVAAHNRDWETATKSAKPSVDADTNTTNRAATQTYTVQSGDTLSTIAARFLGSSGRFQEIYDANRQVLRSPDDIRQGMQLTIPSGTNTASTKGSERSSRPSRASATTASSESSRDTERSTSPAVNTEGKPTKSMFAPVNRGFFNPGRTSRGAAATQDRPRRAAQSGVELDGVQGDE